ncbi:MAG: murein L,D-transpeptidase catalytic domain family protein [Bacteroidetes bacterium]|nr:murein L,D-transpeptidase catalytic domain family protein [Bacteroidota bacterium]
MLIIGAIAIGIGLYLYNNTNQPKKHNSYKALAEKRFKKELTSLKIYLEKHPHYNQEIAFFIDMKIPSSKNRFFVYNLQENKMITQGLVAHGTGSETDIEGELKFSNIKNSLCTSLGKYEVGNSYSGQFGKAYKLIGFDTSNNNALVRNIVLHKYEMVPFAEQNEVICNSYGCPMVNEKFFMKLEEIIDEAQHPILMKIYYE